MTMRDQPAPIRASLVALNGDLEGTRFTLNMETVVGVRNCGYPDIGFAMSAVNQFGVSRAHLRIVFVDDHFVMEDLNSTHGSFWNDEPVRSHALAHGDLVRAGSAVLRFEIESTPTASKPNH